MDELNCYLPSYSYSFNLISGMLGIDERYIEDMKNASKIYKLKVEPPYSLISILKNPSYLLYFDKLNVDDFALRQIKAPYSEADFNYVTKNSILDNSLMKKITNTMLEQNPYMLYDLIMRLEEEEFFNYLDIEKILAIKTDRKLPSNSYDDIEHELIINNDFKISFKNFTSFLAASKLKCPVYNNLKFKRNTDDLRLADNLSHILRYMKKEDDKECKKLVNEIISQYNELNSNRVHINLFNRTAYEWVGLKNEISTVKDLNDILDLRKRDYLEEFRTFVNSIIKDVLNQENTEQEIDYWRIMKNKYQKECKRVRKKIKNDYPINKLKNNITQISMSAASAGITTSIGLLYYGSTGAVLGSMIGSGVGYSANKILSTLLGKFKEWKNSSDLWYYYINPETF